MGPARGQCTGHTADAGQTVPDLAVTDANLNAATVTDTAGNAANLTGATVNPTGTLAIAPNSIAAFDTSTDQAVGVVAHAYTGPVADLHNDISI
jgi:large repetitive protein